MSRILLMAAAIAVASPSTAQPATARQVADQWVVGHDAGMCVLQRRYGKKERPTILSIKPVPMSHELAVHVIETSTRGPYSSRPGRISFGSAEPQVAARFSGRQMMSGEQVRHSAHLTRQELERAARSGVIALKAPPMLDQAFATPGLNKALVALDECVADRLAAWGFSRERQTQLGQLPEPVVPVQRLVSPADYPADAVARRASGRNIAVVRVDSHGRPSDCRIVQSSGTMSLDEISCTVLLRARLTPARDKAGQPMDSIYPLQLRWMITG